MSAAVIHFVDVKREMKLDRYPPPPPEPLSAPLSGALPATPVLLLRIFCRSSVVARRARSSSEKTSADVMSVSMSKFSMYWNVRHTSQFPQTRYKYAQWYILR